MNIKRYNEQTYLKPGMISYLTGLGNEMMQDYGSTAKLLSDFGILNQVSSSLSFCLKLFLILHF